MRPSENGFRQFRVRRLPDTPGSRDTRRHYEVTRFEARTATPSWVRQTDNPAALLRDEGVHPTDIHDYLSQADAAWHGGVGPWRSAFPSENQP